MSEPARRASPRLLDAPALWEYALRTLASRAHSVSQMRQKLCRRAVAADDVAPTLSKLEEYGLLDDRRYAEAYAAARIENKGFGKHRVLRDLKQCRVPSKVARLAVEAAFQDTDETELIESFLRRKYRKVALGEHLAEPRNLVSAYRKLIYGGFSPAGAIRVLKRYSPRAEDLESLEEGNG